MEQERQESVAIRFGFGNSSIPNLLSREGLPVNLFRTDPIGTGDLKY